MHPFHVSSFHDCVDLHVQVFKAAGFSRSRCRRGEGKEGGDRASDTSFRCSCCREIGTCGCVRASPCVCVYVLFRACCMFASIASACGREERQAQASNIWGRLILIYARGRLLSETLYKHMYAWELDRPRRVVFGALPERASCRWPRVGA